LNDKADVRTNKTYQSLVHAAEGYNNLSFIECDIKNCLSKQSCALGKEGDDQALLKRFSRIRELNKDFSLISTWTKTTASKMFFGQMQEVGLRLNTLEMLYHLIQHAFCWGQPSRAINSFRVWATSLRRHQHICLDI